MKKERKKKNKNKQNMEPYHGWWVFQNVPWKKKRTWIDQFRRYEIND